MLGASGVMNYLCEVCMIEFLLALSCGAFNAWRGDGNKILPFTIPSWKIIPEKMHGKLTSCTKPLLLLWMGLVMYYCTNNIWISIAFPLSLGASWSVKDGTGGYMPWVVKKLLFLGFGTYTWRLFEFLVVVLDFATWYGLWWMIR
jgi:hypothetical protein